MALPDWNPKVLRQARGITNGNPVSQAIAVAIDHEHAEKLIVDMPLDERRGVGKDLIEVQRCIYLFADFRECGEQIGGHLRR